MYESIKKIDWLSVADNKLIGRIVNNDGSAYILRADIEGISFNITEKSDQITFGRNSYNFGISKTAKFELECKADKDGVFFTMFSEKAPPKPLTKIEIEKILGYEIKIVP